MTYQVILVILVIIIVVLLLTRKGRTRLRSGLRRGKEVVTGICATALGQTAKKRENKEKILALLSQKSEASNSDIREALGVSRQSVVNYLDELEKEGKVEQIGDVGRGVIYQLKQ